MLDALIGAVAVVAGAAWWRRRNQPVAEPELDDEQRRCLAQQLPLLAGLTPAQQERHARKTAQLLAQVRFYGCQGFEPNAEQALLIAGMACLLELRDEAPPFPLLRSVLLYPQAFAARHEEPDELGLVDDEPTELLGESWSAQRVILSWADVQAALHGDPVNVVVHEFAHQLDDEAPDTEGAPPLADYSRWSRIMRANFEALNARPSPVLDGYGAQSPGEFFAVATEAYIQTGAALRRHHPELYGLLDDYYQLRSAETAARIRSGTAAS